MTTPVYLLAMLDVTDMGALLADYVAPLEPINERHGVKTIVATPTADVLEGDYNKTVTVVLEFPTRVQLDAWYADPDYAPLMQRRLEVTNPATSSLVVVEAAG